MLVEAGGGRFPDQQATLGRALGKYLEVADLKVSTREAHEGYGRRTIGPVLGEVKIRKLGADSLDVLYTALKKCSRLRGRLPRIEHYTDGEHSCDQRCGPLRDHRTTRSHVCDARCRPHVCKPMKPATILRIHSIISSALDLAVRYDWAERNVAKNASPPHPRKREPDPPSPDQAARLLNLVWTKDEEFGLYLWTAITTGARRGEVSALRENRFDFTRQVAVLTSVGAPLRPLPPPRLGAGQGRVSVLGAAGTLVGGEPAEAEPLPWRRRAPDCIVPPERPLPARACTAPHVMPLGLGWKCSLGWKCRRLAPASTMRRPTHRSSRTPLSQTA